MKRHWLTFSFQRYDIYFHCFHDNITLMPLFSHYHCFLYAHASSSDCRAASAAVMACAAARAR
jgi:hypothetical protein